MERCCYGSRRNMLLVSGSRLHTGCWCCYGDGPVDSKGGSPDMDSNWSPSIHTWISSQLRLRQCSSHLFSKEMQLTHIKHFFSRLEAQFCPNIFTLSKAAACRPKHYSAAFPPTRGTALLHQRLASSRCGIFFWSLAIGRIFGRSLNKDSTLTSRTLCSPWASRTTGSSPGCCHGHRGWREIYSIIILASRNLTVKCTDCRVSEKLCSAYS